MTPLEAAQAELARRQLSPAEAAEAEIARRGEAPVTAKGLGKSVATGTRSGVEGLVSAPGDLVTWELRKAAELARMLGADEATVQAIQNYGSGAGDGPGSRGPGMATNEDVRAATDVAVQQLPQGAAEAVQDVTRHRAGNVFEEGAETVGNFLPGAAIPGGPMTRIARVLFPAAAVEGTGQATRALAPEYEQEARLVAGILSGVIAGGAETSARMRGALQKLGTTPEGVARVKQLLQEEGMTPQEATAAVKELGPEGMLLDTGSGLRKEAQQIHAAGGEGRTTLDTRLREREAQTNPRLERDVSAAVGPQLQRQEMLQALKDRAQSVNAEYPEAHRAQTKPVETQSILDKIDSELGVVKSPKIGGILERVKKSLMLRDTATLDPSSEGLHAARKAIDAELYDVNGKPKMDLSPEEAGTLKHYRGLIDEALGEANPAIKAVDEKRAQVGKEERAFGRGEEVFDAKRGMASPQEFQQTWDTLSTGERARTLEGVNVETWRQLGINANDRTKLQQLLKGEGKWNQQKLATIVGEDKAQALMDALAREKVFQESYQKVVQGSKTAETQRAPARGFGEAVSEAAPDMLAGGAIGGPGGAIAGSIPHLRRFVADRLRRGGGTGARDAEVARLLSSGDPDDLVEAVRILQGLRSSRLPAGMLGGLLARQQEREERR
jgi:hypothetical protein